MMNDRISDKLKVLKPSGIRKFFDIVATKKDVISLGVGEPDFATPWNIVDAAFYNMKMGRTHYTSNFGLLEFRKEVGEYLKKYDLDYGPDEIIATIGGSEGIDLALRSIINPGDEIIVPEPVYVPYRPLSELTGATVVGIDTSKTEFKVDAKELEKLITPKTKAIILCYPNNPTGQVATKEFFENVVKFAQKNNIIVIHDAAYAALTYNDVKPLSFLSVDGAIDVGVEIHSLSKAFNMTGWRLGFLVGNEKIVSAYGVVKDNTDSGQFRAIQKAGAFALNNRWITENTVNKYSRRFKMLIEALNEVGFNCVEPKGTFYSYVKIPTGTEEGVKFNTALEVARYILLNANISVVPWDDCGHYLRFSVTFSATHHEEKIIIDEMKNRLKSLKFVF